MGLYRKKVGGMPKENINDIVTKGFRAEVSWRPEERVCPDCGTIWQAPVPDCPECPRKNVAITSGHVQLATVSQNSPFVFPANPAAPDAEPAEPFDGWHVTLDQAAIERTIDALMRAGTAAFPNWKRDWSTDNVPDPA